MSSANSVSRAVGAPNERPSRAARGGRGLFLFAFARRTPSPEESIRHALPHARLVAIRQRMIQINQCFAHGFLRVATQRQHSRQRSGERIATASKDGFHALKALAADDIALSIGEHIVQRSIR